MNTSLPYLRPLLPGDEPLVHALFARLTPVEIRHRFGHAMRELPEGWAEQWCSLDDQDHVGWGLFGPSADGKSTQLHGISQAFIDRPQRQAEWAVVLESALCGQGWGERLGRRIVSLLDAAGIETITVSTSADNSSMSKLARKLGFHTHPTDDATQTQFLRQRHQAPRKSLPLACQSTPRKLPHQAALA